MSLLLDWPSLFDLCLLLLILVLMMLLVRRLVYVGACYALSLWSNLDKLSACRFMILGMCLIFNSANYLIKLFATW
jgi:hypothetical protein